MTTLKLRNFRSIADRRFDTQGKMTLLAGPNGSGKTNVILALRALLTGEGLPYGLLKKDASVMVTDGAKNSTAVMENEHWTITGHWPSGKIETTGTPPRISSIASGVVNVCDLCDEERAEVIGRVIGATPDEKRLADELIAIGVPDDVAPVKAKSTIADWETAVANASRIGVELKGKYKALTGETWGINKGDGWVPKDWTADLAKASVKELEDRVSACEAILADVERNISVSTHTKEQADEAARRRIGLQSRWNDLDKQIDDLNTKRNNSPLPVPEPQKCPHCDAGLMVVDGKIVEAVNAIASDKNEERRAIRKKLGDEIEALATERNAIKAEIGACQIIENGCKVPGRCTPSDKDVASTELSKAKARLDMVRVRDEAAALHANLTLNHKAQALLAPDGIKRTVLLERLKELNALLSELSRIARWDLAGGGLATVEVDADLKVRYGGKDYRWGISEAQQFRAAVTVQCALSIIGGDAAVIIDRADILDSGGRNGLVTMIEASALAHAFIGMTISSKESMPDLAAAGIGASYWLGV